MKKSEVFRFAADAVLDSEYKNHIKLDILNVLLKEEELAIYTENREENEAAVDEA